MDRHADVYLVRSSNGLSDRRRAQSVSSDGDAVNKRQPPMKQKRCCVCCEYFASRNKCHKTCSSIKCRRERKNKYAKHYYQANREYELEASARRYQANRKHLDELHRRRVRANPIPMRERQKRWVAANREHVRAYRRSREDIRSAAVLALRLLGVQIPIPTEHAYPVFTHEL
jgi:hypothetical protein